MRPLRKLSVRMTRQAGRCTVCATRSFTVALGTKRSVHLSYGSFAKQFYLDFLPATPVADLGCRRSIKFRSCRSFRILSTIHTEISNNNHKRRGKDYIIMSLRCEDKDRTIYSVHLKLSFPVHGWAPASSQQTTRKCTIIEFRGRQ